jgi:hypothetical protein
MSLLIAGCGTPTLPVAESISVVFNSLSNADQVELDIIPRVVFSDEVDSTTVTPSSFFLESAEIKMEQEEWACSANWSAVEGSAVIDSQNGNTIDFVPSGPLEVSTCYRLVCGTSLRGMTQGPLKDLHIPDRPGIGFEAQFRTK